jgi:xylulokinase
MSVLGIDLGTTGCKSAAFSRDGRCLAQAYCEYAAIRSQPGRVELDSREVWGKVRQTIREVASQTRRDPVTALCTSSFGEAFVPVSRNREILGNSILSTDLRGKEYADVLERDFGQGAFYRINPNILGPQYSLPKLLWLRDHEPELFARADYFLSWADLVPFLLGCEPVAVNSLANRSLLLDFRQNDWSDELLAWGGMERKKLGRVVPGGTPVGTVSQRAAAELGLPAEVRVVAGGHDQCCNALGAGCVRPAQAVCGIGTFECITPTFGEVRDPLSMLSLRLNMEHHVVPGLYVSFLYHQAGVLVKWFRDTFAAADAAPEGTGIYSLLNREIPEAPTNLLVLPYFDPPQWPVHLADTSGVIMGLKTSTSRGEILKSIMECETLYFADSLTALKKLGVETREFVATGGGARSDAWLQIKADIFGLPFVRPRISEGSLLGAAMLAGIATGVYGNAAEAVEVFVRPERRFDPDPSRHAIYQEKLRLYRELFPATRKLLGELHRAD